MLASVEALTMLELSLAAITSVDEKELPKHLAEADRPWPILATTRVSAALLRAIRRAPPHLLIVAGKVNASERERVDALIGDGVPVLGPEAFTLPATINR
jgi:hypothetical protein